MSEHATSSPRRRPELEQAFQHLAKLTEEVDLTGLNTPRERWLATVRTMVANYGGMGSAVDLSDMTFTPVDIDGVRAEWITADGADGARRIVYLHGGGWVAGGEKSHKPFLAALARLSKASILFVDYRLAPEHPYPAPLDDCVAAFEWALRNGPDSEAAGRAGADPATRVSIAGDSAGGNLAAATCVRRAAAGARLPDRLVLIGAALDNVSMWERVGVDDAIVNPEVLTFSIDHYLSPSQSAAAPEISPVFASNEILGSFPPTLIQVSTLEAVLYDCRKFTDRLEKAGVRVNLSLWPDVPHVWHAFLDLFPEAGEALAEVADFVNR